MITEPQASAMTCSLSRASSRERAGVRVPSPPTLQTLLTLITLLSTALCSAAPIESDICIYGGTSGGIAAAIQSSRMGRKVVLLEFGKHIGGLTTGGLGATDIGNKAAIGG